MDHILNIETSTGVCSVSISSDGTVAASRESRVEKSHASMLTVFIDEVMKETEMRFGGLSAVAVSRGPGSFTGLRIGVSAAKGICYGAGLPLIAVDTLRVMALKVIRGTLSGSVGPVFPGDSAAGRDIPDGKMPGGPANGKTVLCPMIDARRMEVYTALYDTAGRQIRDIRAEIIDGSGISDLPEGSRMIFFGDGAEKCKEALARPDTLYLPGIYPSALQMPELSHAAFREGRLEDTAYFEPFYLKDFLATTPKKNRLV